MRNQNYICLKKYPSPDILIFFFFANLSAFQIKLVSFVWGFLSFSINKSFCSQYKMAGKMQMLQFKYEYASVLLKFMSENRFLTEAIRLQSLRPHPVPKCKNNHIKLFIRQRHPLLLTFITRWRKINKRKTRKPNHMCR